MESYYYTIVALSVFYIFFKSGINYLSVFVVLIFWEGLFGFYGIFKFYKIIIFAYALLFFSQKILIQYSSKEKYINLFFILFSISFWLSYFINGGDLITILSQYGFKYGMIFLIYHGFKGYIINDYKKEYLKRLLLRILTVQVILSVFKILILGFPVERNVGSLAHGAGGPAVVIPIIGLIFYWMIKNGQFKLKDWLFASSLLLIAIASGKRSPMILFPLVIAILFIFSHDKFRFSRIIKYSPIAVSVTFILLYVGLRLMPTLNPENRVWGSFDPEYTNNYILMYNFGTTELDEVGRNSQGRGASLFLLFSPRRINLKNETEILFGKGLYETAVLSHGRFLGGSSYGIDHTGLIGSFVVVIYSLGYIGFLSMLCFSLAIISTVKQSKLKYILIGFYLYEFFLYGNQVVFNNSSAVLLAFICLYNSIINNFSTELKADKVKQNQHENLIYTPYTS